MTKTATKELNDICIVQENTLTDCINCVRHHQTLYNSQGFDMSTYDIRCKTPPKISNLLRIFNLIGPLP